MTTEQAKEIIVPGVDVANLPRDAEGSVADLVLEPHLQNNTERYVESLLKEEAATTAHPEVLNGEAVKARVDEIIMGQTHKLAEDMYDALVGELILTTVKLKTAKEQETRAQLLDQIDSTRHKLGIILETFIAK